MEIRILKVRDSSGRVVWEGGVSSTLVAIFTDAMRTLDYTTEEMK